MCTVSQPEMTLDRKKKAILELGHVWPIDRALFWYTRGRVLVPDFQFPLPDMQKTKTTPLSKPNHFSLIVEIALEGIAAQQFFLTRMIHAQWDGCYTGVERQLLVPDMDSVIDWELLFYADFGRSDWIKILRPFYLGNFGKFSISFVFIYFVSGGVCAYVGMHLEVRAQLAGGGSSTVSFLGGN